MRDAAQIRLLGQVAGGLAPLIPNAAERLFTRACTPGTRHFAGSPPAFLTGFVAAELVIHTRLCFAHRDQMRVLLFTNPFTPQPGWCSWGDFGKCLKEKHGLPREPALN